MFVAVKLRDVESLSGLVVIVRRVLIQNHMHMSSRLLGSSSVRETKRWSTLWVSPPRKAMYYHRQRPG